MFNNKRWSLFSILCSLLLVSACAPTLPMIKEETSIVQLLPKEFPAPSKEGLLPEETEKINTGSTSGLPNASDKVAMNVIWRSFYADKTLSELITTALTNNQDLNSITQEVTIANNEIMARRGELFPKLGLDASAGYEKVGEYTSQGVSDKNDQYEPGKRVPEKLPYYGLGVKMSWEVDIWKKLRNATKSALLKYMASVDGRNYMVTRIVAEVANTYYDLLALDKQLEIVQNNVEIQTQALDLVRLQMQAARVTALAVKRFEAEVLKNRSHQYEIKQKIVETENRLNFLLGRLPQPIPRTASNFIDLKPKPVETGVPSQLLSQRRDVQEAERKLEAAKLDVKVARARFYPSLSIDAGAGYESFNGKHLFESPQSVFYNVAGNLTAPLLNRMGIKADYYSANAKQIQALYDYERVIINAYTEVVNQLSMIDNAQKQYALKSKQVSALNDSVEISGTLFKAARADYVEVLMTRRDAFEAQIDLIDIKKQQLSSFINLYQSLGGGWKQ